MKIKIIALFILLLSFTLSAQVTTTNATIQKISGKNYVSWVVSLDSLESEYSQAFSFSGYEPADFVIYYGADIGAVSGGSGYGVLVTHYVTYDGGSNWVLADTVCNLTSATPSTGNYDLNNKIAPQHKLKAYNSAYANALRIGLYIKPND